MFWNTAYAASLPLQGSDVAVRWDALYNFLLILSLFFFVLIVGAMVYFAIKYRYRPGAARAKYITGNHMLEAIWIIIPTVLLMVIFGWGYSVYHDMTQAPTDAYEVRVIAKQWLWQFQYENGTMTTGELYVPLNRPVKLIMTSEDVLHSFFIPNFRIKQDVVPGMYTSVWFEAKVPGQHQIYCAEYCGTAHSGMLAQAIVLDEGQWKDWYAGKKLGAIPKAGEALAQNQPAAKSDALPTSQANAVFKPELGLNLAQQGKHLSETRGCIACHSADGSSKIGPTFKALYGHAVELSDGSHVQADENYLRQSIEEPQARLVKGYSPVMPTFKGQMNSVEINALVAYIKSLK